MESVGRRKRKLDYFSAEESDKEDNDLSDVNSDEEGDSEEESDDGEESGSEEEDSEEEEESGSDEEDSGEEEEQEATGTTENLIEMLEEDEDEASLLIAAADEAEENQSQMEEETCAICLADFEEQTIGNPESCKHIFCLPCIQEWAKNTNSCPVDRKKFNRILVKKSQHGSIMEEIYVEDKELAEKFEVEEDPTFCEICHSSENEDRLLLCDECDNGYHLECLDPPLSAVPIEEWYCPECAPTQVLPTASTSTAANRSARSSRRGRGARSVASRRASRQEVLRDDLIASILGYRPGRRRTSRRGRGASATVSGRRNSKKRKSRSTSKKKVGTKKKRKTRKRKSTSKSGGRKKSSGGSRISKKGRKSAGATSKGEEVSGSGRAARSSSSVPATSFSIFGNPFDLNEFHGGSDEDSDGRAEDPKPEARPRNDGNPADVLGSIMTGLDVLENGEVYRDGSVVAKQPTSKPPRRRRVVLYSDDSGSDEDSKSKKTFENDATVSSGYLSLSSVKSEEERYRQNVRPISDVPKVIRQRPSGTSERKSLDDEIKAWKSFAPAPLALPRKKVIDKKGLTRFRIPKVSRASQEEEDADNSSLHLGSKAATTSESQSEAFDSAGNSVTPLSSTKQTQSRRKTRWDTSNEENAPYVHLQRHQNGTEGVKVEDASSKLVTTCVPSFILNSLQRSDVKTTISTLSETTTCQSSSEMTSRTNQSNDVSNGEVNDLSRSSGTSFSTTPREKASIGDQNVSTHLTQPISSCSSTPDATVVSRASHSVTSKYIYPKSLAEPSSGTTTAAGVRNHSQASKDYRVQSTVQNSLTLASATSLNSLTSAPTTSQDSLTSTPTTSQNSLRSGLTTSRSQSYANGTRRASSNIVRSASSGLHATNTNSALKSVKIQSAQEVTGNSVPCTPKDPDHYRPSVSSAGFKRGKRIRRSSVYTESVPMQISPNDELNTSCQLECQSLQKETEPANRMNLPNARNQQDRDPRLFRPLTNSFLNHSNTGLAVESSSQWLGTEHARDNLDSSRSIHAPKSHIDQKAQVTRNLAIIKLLQSQSEAMKAQLTDLSCRVASPVSAMSAAQPTVSITSSSDILTKPQCDGSSSSQVTANRVTIDQNIIGCSSDRQILEESGIVRNTVATAASSNDSAYSPGDVVFVSNSNDRSNGGPKNNESAEKISKKSKASDDVQRKDRIVDEVKLALKSYYNSRQITKEEYKSIFKKGVDKIYLSGSSVDRPRVTSLVRKYVERYRNSRKSS